MTANRHCVYLYCGSIYDMNGRIIEHPALLIDKSDGCVHGYGDAGNLSAKLVKMADAWRGAGMQEMADDLMLMDFSDAWYKGMTNDEICYVIRRAVEFTATPFQKALCLHAMSPDFLTWLRSEMQRMPLDLSMEQRPM